MAEGLTAIIVAHNEMEAAKLTIETLRMFADVEDLDVVLVDNASTDDLRNWASKQEDFTYIYMDEGREKLGSLVNQVVQALEIQTDLLIMEAHYGITPFALSRLRKELAAVEEAGVVVPLFNGVYQRQQLDTTCTDFQSAAIYAEKKTEYAIERSMGIEGGAFLIRKEVYDQIGGLESQLSSTHHLAKDLSLSLLEYGKQIVICKGAILWDLTASSDILPGATMFFGWDEDLRVLEEKWGMHYFNLQYNGHIVSAVCTKAKPAMKVLEVGCDLGATLFEIKNRCPDAEIYGCELNPNAVKVASYFMEAEVCNIEEEKVPFEVDGFDFIIFGDVLEHLRNPLKALQYSAGLLKKGGRIVASIPNLMHISVMEGLLGGNFTYTETGLLDKTHIHFFTYNEILRMFEQAQLTLEDLQLVMLPISKDQDALIQKLLLLNDKAEEFMYKTFQYLVVATN